MLAKRCKIKALLNQLLDVKRKHCIIVLKLPRIDEIFDEPRSAQVAMNVYAHLVFLQLGESLPASYRIHFAASSA